MNISIATSSACGAMTSSAEPVVQQHAEGSGLPDFYIVGSAKSGTTALYQILRGHPQIFMPDSKEPWFFASELQEHTPPRPEGTPRTLEEYRSRSSPSVPPTPASRNTTRSSCARTRPFRRQPT